MLLVLRREAKRPLLIGRVILVFLWIFTKSQASSNFEAMNSEHLSMCQKNVRPFVQKRWRTLAFSRVSTGYSINPSSCEMKYEPAFQALHWTPAFSWVRASRGPFHLRQKTPCPSHIPISEGRLLLRCLWKVGLPLQSKTGNHSHPQTIWATQKFPQAALMKLMILYTWDGFLRESLQFPKGSQATCLDDVDRGMYMEPMQGKLASSQFDLRHTDLFCIPEVTSVFFSSCDSVVGDSR